MSPCLLFTVRSLASSFIPCSPLFILIPQNASERLPHSQKEEDYREGADDPEDVAHALRHSLGHQGVEGASDASVEGFKEENLANEDEVEKHLTVRLLNKRELNEAVLIRKASVTLDGLSEEIEMPALALVNNDVTYYNRGCNDVILDKPSDQLLVLLV